jgi:superfamily II DNA/RNA helicase
MINLLETLLETLQKNKGKRAMIFCNSIETCKNVHQMLHNRGYNATLASSDLGSKKRAQNFQQFSDGEAQILISTDLASRGIDTVAMIDHVILYDFPQNVIDYIHRY